jgi:glyoxylase I family protein
MNNLMNTQNFFGKKFTLIVLFLSLQYCSAMAFVNNSQLNNITNTDTSFMNIERPEHIALNVADPVSISKWYVENLGMQIIKQGDAPNFTTFIADSGKHIMFELYHNANYPLLDAANINYLSLHFAFMVSDIGKTKEKLLKAGARIAEDITKSPAGDQLLMLHDPWGLSIQFIHRSQPMLKFSEFRPEHAALNVAEPVKAAEWFVDNFGMKIIRQSGAPTFTTFISDNNENYMIELFHNSTAPVLNLNDVNYNSLHFAFTVNNIELVKEKLIKAGATLAEDIKTTQSGDKVLMLRAPWGQPLQFVLRQKPMLK